MKAASIWALELGIAALAMWIDMRLFWLYFFFSIAWLINRRIGYLRKIVRTYQIYNELKLLAIASKLGVEESDFTRQYETMRQRMSAKQLSALEEDLKEVFDEAGRMAQV